MPDYPAVLALLGIKTLHPNYDGRGKMVIP
jgi:hypothetical protein